MQNFLAKIKTKAQANPKRIIFPEALLDERIMEAAQILNKEQTARVMLLGERVALEDKLKEYDLAENEFLELVDWRHADKFAEQYTGLRKAKGMDLKQAQELMQDVNYYGTMMVVSGLADGMISGTTFPTADTIRPALQLLVTKDDFARVSGFFFLIIGDRIFVFADCAVNVDPSPEDLAGIALDTAKTAKQFGLIPKIAMLSFSTRASAQHPLVEKVRVATQLVRDQAPGVLVDGEIQVDAAMVPEVATKKAPGSPIQGDANILIFPSLEAGNIGYKLVERLAKAKAIGPILQGLDKPVNDLSRGCNVLDIVNLAAITSIQSNWCLMYFLTINCGSSSIKVDLVDPTTHELFFSDTVERLETGKNTEVYERSLSLLVSKMLQKGVIDSLDQINIVCHRVVHGGEKYVRPTLIKRRTKTDIYNLSDIAPLHNPYNLEGIYAAEKMFKCPHYAVFDTAFHTTIPLENHLYALPYKFYKKHRIRRYGFHGISHNYIANKAADLMKNKRIRLVSCHLGSGCSVTAIRNGESVDCSMGFTPLEGVPMSTRSGDIDPAIIFYMIKKLKMKPEEVEDVLVHKSGWLGLSEHSSDMRDLLEPPRKHKAGSQRAINFFVLKVARKIMSQYTLLGRLDALVFTAGVGERSALIRKLICQYLEPFGVKIDRAKNERGAIEITHKNSTTRVFVVPTQESLQMAMDTYQYVK